ncbi:hypothetical protein B0H17DRAFT_1123782 [Mycena rosella]|uniref:Uncharacterized protein n=1 Tax=Mycena rosella TaxID=1033263 RepID=A0AAD7H2I1_MYCRO|nr:hypothetical protein B0H17DRAFT_1123782 [Mycena rosella]
MPASRGNGRGAKRGRDKSDKEPPKRAKTEGGKREKPLADTTRVRFTTVAKYEPVGASAPKLFPDEAFCTCKCNFDLDVLKQRPKNRTAKRDKMQATVDAMKEHAGRATSCIVVDRKGRILIAYFSEREMTCRDEEGESEDEDEEPCVPAKPLKRKHQRKADAARKTLTMEEFLAKRAEFFLAKAKPISEFYNERVPAPGARVWHDGIPRAISKRAHQGTQDFAADRQPHLEERDVWHTIPDDSETSAVDPRLVELPASTITPRERATKGTRIDTHLRGGKKKKVSAFEKTPDESIWPQQLQHKVKLSFTTSKVTYPFALVVSERFHGVSPDYHARYLKAFNAGCYLPNDDPGPFIGRAIVWKLQVWAHLDGLEGGPVATTPEGAFRRGGLVFPDFAQFGQVLKFRYTPGDLCLSFARALYHGVEEWEPLPVDEKDILNKLIPGRISTVFFFPQSSLSTLEDKAAGWSRDTAGGLLPSFYCREMLNTGLFITYVQNE